LLGSALPAQLIVAFRRVDGTVSGRPAGRRLKRALQAGALPPWERSVVPLIYAGRRLLAVGDWWRAAECTAGEAARSVRRWRLHWRRGDYLRQAL
jgi:tRNA(Ile)-lysidine synthetase-like protein